MFDVFSPGIRVGVPGWDRLAEINNPNWIKRLTRLVLPHGLVLRMLSFMDLLLLSVFL